MAKIIIGMPTFNSINTVENSICSFLNQSFTDFILLIFDDCSNDGTYEFIRTKFSSESRIHFLPKNKKNIGINKAFNYLINQASRFNCKYFIFASDHDTVEKHFLKFLYKTIKLKKASLVYPKSIELDKFGNDLETYITKPLSFTKFDIKQQTKALYSGVGYGNIIYGLFDYQKLKALGGIPDTILSDRLFLSIFFFMGYIYFESKSIKYRLRIFYPDFRIELKRQIFINFKKKRLEYNDIYLHIYHLLKLKNKLQNVLRNNEIEHELNDYIKSYESYFYFKIIKRLNLKINDYSKEEIIHLLTTRALKGPI